MAKDYLVGYGRPPEHTRWEKGQSGNRKGRPKKKRSAVTDIAEILDEPIAVKKAGRANKMSPFEISIRQLARKALKGNDLNAALEFVQICEKYGVVRPAPMPIDGGGVLVIPKTWDRDEWMQMFKTHGPPPWPGQRSGLPGD